MFKWLISLFSNKKAKKALEFSKKLVILFDGFEQKEQNYKNATIDTFIALLNEHKEVIK